MKRLRVCHIIHDTNVGGTESMLLEVLRQQVHAEVESAVISLLNCGPIGDRLLELGIPVTAVKLVGNGVPQPHRLLGLKRALNEFRPDVVQTWAYHADLCGGVAARLVGSAPVIWNIRHGTLDPSVDSRNTLRSAGLCARLSKRIPTRILLNSHAAVTVHQKAGYESSKMHVIPNGFDTHRFQRHPLAGRQLRSELGLDADVPLVGMCGRFHPHKGQHDFLKAARQILRRHPTAQFLMAGDGCEDTNVQLAAWLVAHRVRDRVHLLGCRDDMPRLLSALDVFLLPSITEGMPNVVGEAMSCGTPCIVTDVGDARRLVADCGVTVPAGSPDQMAAAVSELLNKPLAERETIGRKSRERIIQHFDIRGVAAEYRSIWCEVAERAQERKVSKRRRFFALPAFARDAIGEQAVRSRGVGSGMPLSTRIHTRPKLVHVTTIPLTQWLFLRGQNPFMQARGFEVHAVSSPGAYLEKLRGRDRVLTHEVPVSRRITPLRDLTSVYQLWKLFRRLRPEIVQLSTPKAALLGAIAARAAGVPVRIYQIRGLSSESESGWKRVVFQRLERLTARLCNGCLVNAKSLLEYARHANILAGNEGTVVRMGMSNGVDLARLDPASARAANLQSWDSNWTDGKSCGPVIGYVGRLTRDKGLEELFAAWSNVRDEFPTARLLLVGPWEAENPPAETCRAGLRADPRVLLVGAQDDVVPFYKAMDMFVFASHGTEGFPNAPMEAAAMGLPVIATRVVGCVDAVVDGVTGQIVTPRAAEELESAIRAYLHDPDLRRRHGQAGQARVRSGFAPDLLWEDFFAYYQQQLRRHGMDVPSVGVGEKLPDAA